MKKHPLYKIDRDAAGDIVVMKHVRYSMFSNAWETIARGDEEFQALKLLMLTHEEGTANA